MKLHINHNTLTVTVGDITNIKTDVIVNAANGSLLGGGGVDGAIHDKAGPQLLEECKLVRQHKLNGEFLKTGEAVMTKGYNLPAKYVIHTVGPIWGEEDGREEILLENCYNNCLRLAHEHKLNNIAFPSISTGVYRYPINLASIIALRTISQFLQKTANKNIVITLFSDEDFAVYKQAITKLSL